MSTQLSLYRGIVGGRHHTDREHALLRTVELARQDERRARRALRKQR